ncbi:hypothetical protein EJ03DRAFT_13008 [Teratosphaeria nubilosa]|uniref:Uncharacterized protein n=1 Tax=Teratosphaeria nubilosa TaxID=161662 RepID=A0A6G1KW68_9PEZI|nr:hypothetical protein EJ03DRAFT_13008 [Teratosphaeria nubilosa]
MPPALSRTHRMLPSPMRPPALSTMRGNGRVLDKRGRSPFSVLFHPFPLFGPWTFRILWLLAWLCRRFESSRNTSIHDIPAALPNQAYGEEHHAAGDNIDSPDVRKITDLYSVLKQIIRCY